MKRIEIVVEDNQVGTILACLGDFVVELHVTSYTPVTGGAAVVKTKTTRTFTKPPKMPERTPGKRAKDVVLELIKNSGPQGISCGELSRTGVSSGYHESTYITEATNMVKSGAVERFGSDRFRIRNTSESLGPVT